MIATASTVRSPALDVSADEGVRRAALTWLGSAAEARARLERSTSSESVSEADDAEALHDFRVALRKLRSTLRTFRDLLEESVGKKLERRLKRLATATGGGRDAEVEIAWVREQLPKLTVAERRGAEWWLRRLDERRAREYATIGAVVQKRFGSLAEALAARLSTYRAEIRWSPTQETDDRAQRFGAAVAERLREIARELEELLRQVVSADDIETAHEARIVAKRLRYLLEPLSSEEPAVELAVGRMKKLQEILGELHDAHVLELDLLATFIAVAEETARQRFDIELEAGPARRRAAARRPLDAGLLALATRNRERRDGLFAKLEKGWLGGHARAKAFFAELAALAEMLTGTTARVRPEETTASVAPE